jgi:hypothetical protein
MLSVGTFEGQWTIYGVLICLAGLLYSFPDLWANAALRKIPGPKLYAITRFRLAFDAWQARSIHTIHKLHLEYGNVVRVGPREISFNSLSALRTIYGAGSPFERTKFYHMFDVYGTPNLFTFETSRDHRRRKKLLSHIYANQTVLGSEHTKLVQEKVFGYMQMLEKETSTASEIFSSLHYFSFDTISDFVYGPDHGGTKSLSTASSDRRLLDDILNPARRRMAWFGVHFPKYTRWVSTRTGWMEKLVRFLHLMPMKKPFVYSGIREHALKAFYSFKAASPETKARLSESTVIGRLVRSQKEQNLTDLDIASECADHLLAGIDTTADSLMFLIWALSLPTNSHHQERLRAELSHVSVNALGIPYPKDLTQLPYLNAVLHESLRMYSPLPAFEPRVCASDTMIDGYSIPAGTVVGMSPYCLHRDENVYPDPLKFAPERWLTADGLLIDESDVRNKYFWAFSSGARMCIGMHLANAEMLTLVAAILKKYRTVARHPDTSPGITSRYEVFHDELKPNMVEHECYINFIPL